MMITDDCLISEEIESLSDTNKMDSNTIEAKFQKRQDRLDAFLNTPEDKEANKLKFGPQPVNILSDNDCRTTIKFLVYSSRTITMYLLDTKIPSTGSSFLLKLSL